MRSKVLTEQLPVAPVINHKISAPKAHRHAVEREQLLGRIFGDLAARVVVFQGPAGHGKTSLMLQAESACRTRGMLTGWLSLDETDNDVTRFLGHVQEMVSGLRAEARLGGAANDSGRVSDVTSRTDWLVSRLTELGQPVAVFVDDLHFVSSRMMLGFLRELLAGSPPAIRWFLASRVVPELGLPRLVVGDQAMMIRAEELRFSQDEVQRFFERAGDVEVSAAEVEAIHQGTEGWPAAVQLYRLALDSPAVRQSLREGRAHQVRELADYLADNVLARQDPRVQEFLLKTSMLDRMSVPLCNAVLESRDAQDVLGFLERAGLFVRRVESDQQWFTYHAIFSRFLRDHLRAAYPEAVRQLHRRAAQWHREEGYFEEALHHFSSAGDHGDAAEVFEMWAERLVPDGHMVTVDRWSDTVPMEELERRPGLVVKIVWALSFLSRHRKVEPLLRLLRAIPPDAYATGDPRVALSMVAIMKDDLVQMADVISMIDTSVASPSRFRNFELSAVSNARGYHGMAAGHYGEALRFLARGRALSDGADATFTWAYSIGKSALTLVSQGQLQEALTQFRNALSDPRMYVDESQSTACLACGWIAALYEADELDLAMAQFRQFREIIAHAGIHDYLVVAYRAIARIHDQHNESAEALAVLEEAEQLAFSGQWPRAVRLIGWERVRRELVAGRLDRARIIAGRIEDGGERADTDWVRISEDSEDTVIGRIRLHVHAGESREALRLIQPCLRQATLRTRVHRQIKLHVLSALAHKKSGNEAQAHRSLDQALSLAAPGRYVRALIDEGEEVSQLLLAHIRPRANAAQGGETEGDKFLIGLINIIAPEIQVRSDGRGGPAASATRGAEAFTERERRILSMIVNYMSNDQIAAAMFVTRDTVKYHLKNIYAKLGVKSRLEAIRAVRESRINLQ
ncbi:MAG: LuxR family transcriptional regulator [Panacagrimonas sp.]|nr:LuxR C-terminal-related transcriptional regulator [Panacagrimonas sp.]MCC2658588.1 LuxR family transcriptional regulator [Panacagrimonas sp.]